MAFDERLARLLIFRSPNNHLIEVREGADGNLDPQTLIRHDARHFGLQNPQGLTVDPASGQLFFLDATGPRLVRVEPEADGTFDQAVISTVDLQPTGLADVRGLAFDPTTGNLHVIAGQNLYELTQAGQVAATRDLSEFGIRDPEGMVFAPSGDQTDDPAETNLFVTDQGDIALQAPGGIFELSFTELAVTASTFQSTLVKTTNMGAFSPPSPDPSGLTYVPNGNRLMAVDGEVEETVQTITHFQGANVWEMSLSGSVVRTANISKKAPTVVPMTNEPTGVTWNPFNNHYIFTDDGAQRVYDLNPGADGLVGTSDDTFTFFNTVTQNGDPEGIAFDTWNNRLVVADGVNREIYLYTLSGSLVSQFDVQIHGVVDPESVEFNPDSGTLFVMSSKTQTRVIIETTTGGALLQTIDISAANSNKAAGLAYAPASNGSGAKRFYIVDRGIDNNDNPNIVDGKMYEMTAPSSGSSNAPPTVNAGSDQTITLPNRATLDGTVSDDGLPNPPGTLTTAWSKVSGPGTVTFDNASAVDTTANFSAAGVYTLRLTASDGALSASDDVIITVNSGPVTDLIFADGFESGNLSAWSSSTIDGGDLSVSAAAALVGSSGLQALIDDNVVIFVTDDNPNAEPRYRARFYFDPNSIGMASGENHFIFYGISGTSTPVLRVQFRFSNGNYQLRSGLRDDGSTWTDTGWFTISDAPHSVELDWRAATAAGANNGGLTLWIDGTQKADLTGKDNDTRRIDRGRLGAVNGIDTGTRGTTYFDAFESRRQSYIGP
jgi:uncharacterized protein YjiK